MKKFLLNPLCAIIVSILALCVFWMIEVSFYGNNPMLFYAENKGLEIITYTLYVLALFVVLGVSRGHIPPDKKSTFWALLFLWFAAFLREMGVQHWLTKHDTTAIKIRFFTNPNNPLHEKIITAILVIVVVGTALWLFFKYVKQIFKGFFAFNPLYWTVATFGGIMIVSQFCDRFPSKYFKATHVHLDGDILYWLKLFEEGGEACLPILFALCFIQYTLIKTKK